MNKKGVEGLPLKYVIIAIAAANAVSIILEVTGILRGGVVSTAQAMNQTLSNVTGGITP